MGKNCLIKELKGVVNNDDLVKLDYLKLHVYNPQGQTLNVNFFTTECDYYVRGAQSSVVSHTPGTALYSFGAGEYEVFFKCKYTLNNKVEVNVSYDPSQNKNAYVMLDTEDIAYAPVIRFYNILLVGDISKIQPDESLTSITLYGGSNLMDESFPRLYGSTADIARVWPNVNHIMLTDYSDQIGGSLSALSSLNLNSLILSIWSSALSDIKNLTGNLADLSSHTSIESISFARRNQNFGSIEAFVEGQVSAGRSSGSCVIVNYTAGQFTLNNTELFINGFIKIEYSASGATVKNRDTSAVLATYANGSWTYA